MSCQNPSSTKTMAIGISAVAKLTRTGIWSALAMNAYGFQPLIHSMVDLCRASIGRRLADLGEMQDKLAMELSSEVPVPQPVG